MAFARIRGVVFGACFMVLVIILVAHNYFFKFDTRVGINYLNFPRKLKETVQLGSSDNTSDLTLDPPGVQDSITGNWQTKARAVLNTWGKRCNIPLFFYSRSAASANHPIINAKHAVPLDVPEGRGHLTAKVFAALRYSLKTYGDAAEWFMKADDDTYVIWDNLVSLLREWNPKDALYLGRLFENYLPHGYASGGAGYVISKPAVRMMVNDGPKFPADCKPDGGWEDLEIGRCLAKFGVYPGNTTNSDGRHRFNSDNPITLFNGNKLHQKIYYIKWDDHVEFGNSKVKDSAHVMSRDSVTFHYISPGHMYMFDFMLNRLNRHIPRNTTGNNTRT